MLTDCVHAGFHTQSFNKQSCCGLGGVGFVGSRYVEDTASGKLGAAQELTMSGEKRRGDSSYSDKASGGGSR